MKKILFTGAATLIIAAIFIFMRPSGSFPSLYITSELHPFQVDRNYWHDGQIELSSRVYDVRLRGRGNSTWVRTEYKRPLRIRFAESTRLMSNYAHRDWVLVANHFDLSLMRNYAALYLGSLLGGMNHTPMVQNVQLYINGEYKGLYLLTDERDVGRGRSELTFNENPAVSEYFIELDGHVVGWQAEDNIEGEDYFIVDDLAYSFRYPSGNRLTTEHVQYAKNFITKVNAAFHSNDLEQIAAVVDINSLIDFYIVQELFKNIDVSSFSVFMQIRGQNENRRLYFGPVWDFDRSAGNTIHWYTHEFIFAGWYNIWFREALETPQLAEKIISRWQHVSANQIQQMINRLRYLRRNYAEEFNRNFELHNIHETQPEWLFDIVPEDLRGLTSWEEQSDYLINWLTERVSWLDWYFRYFNEHEWVLHVSTETP